MKKGIKYIQKNPLTIILILLAICILLWGAAAYIESRSSDNVAKSYYNKANKKLSEKEYSTAKLMLDSIKIITPGAYEWRHKANDLKLRIRNEEQTNTLKYIHQQLDTIAIQRKKLLKGQYKNIQNKKYQDLAQYVWQPQYRHTTQSTGNHYLFQVDEQGLCYILTSYKGKIAENIQTLKVTFKDNTIISCKNEFGHQSSKTAIGYTQSISFHGRDAYSIIEALGNENTHVSKFQMIGKRAHSLSIKRIDFLAAKKIAALSRLLVAKQGWLKQQKECINELRFLQKRINKQVPKHEQRDSTNVSKPI